MAMPRPTKWTVRSFVHTTVVPRDAVSVFAELEKEATERTDLSDEATSPLIAVNPAAIEPTKNQKHQYAHFHDTPYFWVSANSIANLLSCVQC